MTRKANLLRYFFPMVMTIIFASCNVGIVGNGRVESRDEKVGDFNKVEISGNFDVYLSQGSTPGLTLEADENILEIIQVRKMGSVLRIETRENIVRASKKNIYLRVKDLERLDLSGAIDLECETPLHLHTLGVEVSGAMEMALDIRAEKLWLNVSGAGDFDLTGNVNRLDLGLSGAGDINAVELESKEVAIELSGAAKVRVFATEKLSADISGAGSVRYKGDPEIRQSISGLGSLKRY